MAFSGGWNFTDNDDICRSFLQYPCFLRQFSRNYYVQSYRNNENFGANAITVGLLLSKPRTLHSGNYSPIRFFLNFFLILYFFISHVRTALDSQDGQLAVFVTMPVPRKNAINAVPSFCLFLTCR
jgi:hypothetical protein